MIDIYKNDLKISYDKSIKGSCINIKNVTINKESYEYKIITEENINCIIKPELVFENNSEFIKYNITGLCSLEQYIIYNKLKKKDITFIITSIEKLLYEIENYLISENSVLIDLKTVFLQKYNNQILLKYIIIPNLSLDFSFEFSKFLIKLMRYVDIEDKDALRMAYELFVKSSKDNYTISDLIEIVNKYKNDDVLDFDIINNFETEFDYNNIIDYDKEIKNIYEKDLIKKQNTEIDNNINIKNNESNNIKDLALNKKDNNNSDNDNYLKIDNETKNYFKNDFFIDFNNDDDVIDDKKDMKYEKFKEKIKKSRRKIYNKSSINIMKLMNIFIPIIIVLLPIIIYILFGKSFVYKNLIKIIVLEIFIIGTYIINLVIDSIDCKQ